MNRTLICCTLILFSAGSALAGNGYERCIKEEKALKSRVADDCSGLKYLFNPSGCFATQKKVREQAGTCAEIARVEKIDTTVPAPAPTVNQLPAPPAPPGVPSLPAKPEATPVGTSPTKAQSTLPDMERLKEENARLKAENERLKAKIEGIKKVAE